MIVVEGIYTLGESLSLKWWCPPREAFHWWRGECSTDPAVRPIVECSIGVSPGQEGTVLRIKRQTQDFWSQQKEAHTDYQPIWKVQSESIDSKDTKWRHLVLVRVPPLKLECDAPTNQFLALWQLWEKKEELVRALPEGFEGLAPRSQCFFQDLSSWLK